VPRLGFQIKSVYMTWVKICGITNLEDAQLAIEAGADAIGFVFHEKSPRCVDPEKVRQIVAELPNNIEKIGVFVSGRGQEIQGEENHDIVRTAMHAGLSGVQIHFASTEKKAGPFNGFSASAEMKQYLALPVKCFFHEETLVENSLMEMKNVQSGMAGIFLDSGTPDVPGGTGKVFDWKKAITIAERIKASGLNLVVAGGLNPANVNEAMHTLKPWGVDVSSGVEAHPGKKDAEKVRAFIAAVRQIEKSIS
jgi:phosphoribosylanthranilate isomerase